jgi:type III pantothenate kinase
MLLTIDIGNTTTSLGLFEKTTDENNPYNLLHRWDISTSLNNTPDEYGSIISNLIGINGYTAQHIKSASLCSVVPSITSTFTKMCEFYFNCSPLVVGTGIKTGINISYDSPRDVGTDRIVDAAATLQLYGGPAIIVDLGTATVFDAIDAKGTYLGGAIAPGIEIAAETLFQKGSQLHRVALKTPPQAIGKNTIHSLQSGLLFGFADLIRGMIKRFKSELKNQDTTVVGTGGLIHEINQKENLFDIINPNLTITGLAIIYHLNKKTTKN